MMQEVLETTGGSCFHVENDSAFVGGKTCWKQTTVGRDFYTGLIGSMRMRRG